MYYVGRMARAYHSASSDAVGRRCIRAWYYEYVEGRRAPDLTWEQIQAGAAHTSRQRSTALGKAVHATLEGWYDAVPVDWHSLPGQIALSGLHHLPQPDRCEAYVETPIGTDELPAGVSDTHSHAFEHDGILWVGYRDLVARVEPAELVRLKINAPDGWLLEDHKSSADVERYALSPDALRLDFAANLYGAATCAELDLKGIPARWVYYETKQVRRSKPVDGWIDREDAERIVSAGSARARELDTIRDEQDAPQNPGACGDYGGCPHHVEAGGPCRVQRSLGALIQARVPKGNTNMPISPKLKALASAQEGAPAPLAAVPPPAPEAVAPAAPPEAPAAPAAAKPRGRPRAAAPIAPVAAAPAPTVANEKTATLPGTFGPLVITGDARDVVDAITALLHG